MASRPAWCVVTDTDFDWAYMAGTATCIEEILAVPEGIWFPDPLDAKDSQLLLLSVTI